MPGAMDELKKLCQEYFDKESAGEYADDDLQHYIFETAMETCFGKGVWNTMKANARKVDIENKKAEIARLQKEVGNG